MDVERFARPTPTPSRVELVAYNNIWPEIASEEAERLKAALGDVLLAVEHFGSTSVPGLAAKPVIDLMPIVTDLPELDSKRSAALSSGWVTNGSANSELWDEGSVR